MKLYAIFNNAGSPVVYFFDLANPGTLQVFSVLNAAPLEIEGGSHELIVLKEQNIDGVTVDLAIYKWD